MMSYWRIIVKILFWNLKNNNNANYIIDLIQLDNIDIAVFCEYGGLDQKYVEENLQDFSFSLGMAGCEKVLFLFNQNITYEVRRESNRYAMYSFIHKSKEYILVGLHLPANPSNDSDTRKDVILDIIRDLNELEKSINNYNTIVIGDFNAGPFDSELTQKNMFNAVPFKDVINNKETITFNNKKYRRFYNPMVNYISEDKKQYGSFRFTGGSNTIVWYCFDQVILRKPLINKLTNVIYCKTIAQTNLLSEQGVPNNKISDHLPLIVEVEENE